MSMAPSDRSVLSLGSSTAAGTDTAALPRNSYRHSLENVHVEAELGEGGILA